MWIDQNGDLSDGEEIHNSVEKIELMPVDKPTLLSATKVDISANASTYDLSLNIHLGGLPLEDLVMIKTGNQVFYEVKDSTELNTTYINTGTEGRSMVDNVTIDASNIPQEEDHETSNDSDFIIILKNSVGMNAYHLDEVDGKDENEDVSFTHLNGYS